MGLFHVPRTSVCLTFRLNEGERKKGRGIEIGVNLQKRKNWGKRKSELTDFDQRFLYEFDTNDFVLKK
jgi:hypothetical protein